MKMLEILEIAKELDASDIHLVVGRPPMFRVSGDLQPHGEIPLMNDDIKTLIGEVLTPENRKKFELEKELDFSFGQHGIGRYRANVHMQRGTIAVALRSITTEIPSMDELKLPAVLKTLTEYKNGLVLVTGPTGSGKSTTLASMINEINENKDQHIITIEDPIEFLHRHKRCLIEQREIGTDTNSFSGALRFALRQDPDIILIGEMRDLETIEAALTASETGHLVFATLHTRDAAQTVDRIVDSFPAEKQQQIRMQLSNSLRGIISQQLIPRMDRGGMVLAQEILIGTAAVGNLIREGKTHQIPSSIETGGRFGMISLDATLKNLVREGKISPAEAEKRFAKKPLEMNEKKGYGGSTPNKFGAWGDF